MHIGRLYKSVLLVPLCSIAATCVAGPVPVIQPPAAEAFSTPENALRSFYVALGMGEPNAIRRCFCDPSKAWYLPPQRIVITAYRITSTRIYSEEDVAFYNKVGTSLDLREGDAEVVVEEFRLGSGGGYSERISYVLRDADGKWKIVYGLSGTY